MKATTKTIIRDAIVEDLPAIVDLYNALIETTTITWTEQLQTLEQRAASFAVQQANGHPVLVAEGAGGAGGVIGFASFGSFRGEGRWPGYRHTVEHTIHVAGGAKGAGVGRLLMDALMDRARALDIHVMVGAIDSDNLSSIRFHERLGFTEVARMPEIGRKFGRWLDLVLMQRVL